MRTLEQRLFDYYVEHRDESWARWIDAVRARNLASYSRAPREQLLSAMGHSMELMLVAVRDGTLTEYTAASRDNFKARLAAGISKEDLSQAADVAWGVVDDLVVRAFENDVERLSMRQRVRRYKMATISALTDILLLRT